MDEILIDLVARSLYFSNANIMFGWQGWAYKHASEWRRLHDAWAEMNIDEKNIWKKQAMEIIENFAKSNPDLYKIVAERFLPSNDRWWTIS